MTRTLIVLLFLAAVGSAATSLAAQDRTEPAPTLIRVAATPDGTVLSLDSASIRHTGNATYWLTAVYQFAPEPARRYGFDRMRESQEMDCAGLRIRARKKQAYAGEASLSTIDSDVLGRDGWSPAPDAERPLVRAMCDTLQRSFAAALPIQGVIVERAPVLLNADAMARILEDEYPARLRIAGISGTAVVHMRVTAEGGVDPAEIELQNASEPEFGAAALRIARRLRFRPARVGGRAVTAWVTLPMNFHASGEAP